MKQIIATEQIFSPLGHRIGVRYWYADGTSREIDLIDRKREAVEKAKMAAEKVAERWRKSGD